MIGIISYLPADPKIRNIRKRNHIKQLSEIIKKFPTETIYIVSQNYQEGDYISNSQITYFKYPDPIGPAEARNVIFRLFYGSDKKCLLMLDDDVIWYDYYDIDSFIKDFYFNPDKYDMDMVVPLAPNLEPFKSQVFNDDLKDYFTFKRISLNICPNVMLIKQVGLYQVGFDKDDPNAINEDKQFLEQFMLKGFKGYKCLNWVKKSYDLNVCSIIETADKQKSLDWHKLLVRNYEAYINDKYAIKGGTKEFNKRYNKADAKRLEKRLRPYSIEKSIVPKEKA